MLFNVHYSCMQIDAAQIAYFARIYLLIFHYVHHYLYLLMLHFYFRTFVSGICAMYHFALFEPIYFNYFLFF